ncbi:WecB/TagA/CpsF family glycosyltransferase [Klenkia terrae]|uniref:WecB/TagA/CpsF family glycosyltransferase n=1 Tax=Klenkia terrae TaxID=1052259 RepID=A0ABU8E3Y1_9ACTN|nr:WecB/TagA/CpsF family glycosyltransferase [Klenkia terrae]
MSASDQQKLHLGDGSAISLALWGEERAVSQLVTRASTSEPAHVHFVNAYTLALAETDPRMRAALSDSNAICLPDGKPLSKLLETLSGHRQLQTRGPSVFKQVIAQTSGRTLRHFLLGSSPAVLDAIERRFKQDGSATNEIVGISSPPFLPISAWDIESIAAQIESANPDIIWLGLGTPKQDHLAPILAKRCDTLVACVGAAFDFYAEHKREAPTRMTQLGLEWLFRWAQEPRRLTRRYTTGNIRFIRLAIRNIR